MKHPVGTIIIQSCGRKRIKIAQPREWKTYARYVMEQYLGRELTKEEVTHHIDRDKLNDDIKNLKLFSSNSEHLKYHREDDKKWNKNIDKANKKRIGTKLSKQHCDNISKALKGRLHSKETRDKISKTIAKKWKDSKYIERVKEGNKKYWRKKK